MNSAANHALQRRRTASLSKDKREDAESGRRKELRISRPSVFRRLGAEASPYPQMEEGRKGKKGEGRDGREADEKGISDFIFEISEGARLRRNGIRMGRV